MPQIVLEADVALLVGDLSLAADQMQSARLAFIIDRLESQLEDHLDRPLVPTVFVNENAVIVDRDDERRVYVHNTPIVSVQTLTVNGVVTVDFEVHRKWLVVGGDPAVGSPVVVDYTAGLSGDDRTSPFGRRAHSILLAAAGKLANKMIRVDADGLTSLSVEGTSYQFEQGELLTELDLKRLTKFSSGRRRGAVFGPPTCDENGNWVFEEPTCAPASSCFPLDSSVLSTRFTC